MLFAASSDVRLLLLWPAVALANGLLFVATLRYLDRRLSARDPGLNSGAAGLEHIGDEARRQLYPVLSVAALLPWLTSLAIGLLPNQTLRWIVVPSAGAILGDEYSLLFAGRSAIPESLMSGIVLASLLAIIFVAFYMYPLPLVRSAVGRRGRLAMLGQAEKETGLRSEFVEAIVGAVAMMVDRWTAVDGILKRMANTLQCISGSLTGFNDSVQENYFYPFLAVCGFAVLLIFLG
jgi:hypothetical protein